MKLLLYLQLLYLQRWLRWFWYRNILRNEYFIGCDFGSKDYSAMVVCRKDSKGVIHAKMRFKFTLKFKDVRVTGYIKAKDMESALWKIRKLLGRRNGNMPNKNIFKIEQAID